MNVIRLGQNGGGNDCASPAGISDANTIHTSGYIVIAAHDSSSMWIEPPFAAHRSCAGYLSVAGEFA